MDHSMQGKVCIVTGANSGLGKATASQLAQMGATVILACRDQAKREAALSEIRLSTDNNSVDLMLVDLSKTETYLYIKMDVCYIPYATRFRYNEGGNDKLRRIFHEEVHDCLD